MKDDSLSPFIIEAVTMTREEISYVSIIQTKCDCCGEMVDGFYCRGNEWWDKYMESNEGNICLMCIASRGGFRDEYLRLLGITVERGRELYAN